eukprot:TRINITY_DN2874_c0_g1_i2.p1 TRINITY_DN2874_c0_g1~~TRINITY_DN2874_c0_g1_i2.p1  ORF type:complete len:1458 (+),score=425.55 TRINITY_DN2874_c0_g1_i2:102-4376(+)
MVLASMATAPGPLGVSRDCDDATPRDCRSPTSVLKAENLRLQEIITKQRQEIEALASSSSQVRSAAVKAVGADAQLSQVLELAEQHSLCSSSQRQVVLDYVRAGRCEPQHCLDVWSRRLAGQSAEAAQAVLELQVSNSQQSTIPDAAAAARAAEAVAAEAAGQPPEVSTENKEGWADVPQEFLRRATRTFTQTLRHEATQSAEPTLITATAPEPDVTEGEPEWRSAASASSCGAVPQVELAGTALPRMGRPFALPLNSFRDLRPYQREGVAWMARLYEAGKGGILADEMGLGKTVQACSVLSGLRRAGGTHALILVPVTLLDQWAAEARKWCPGWPVYVYHGTPSQRARALRGAMQPQGGLLLTSYAVLKNDEDRNLLQVSVSSGDEPEKRKGNCKRKRQEEDEDEKEKGDQAAELQNAQATELPACCLPWDGEQRPWDVVLCDEAHVMRNISTLLGRRLRSIRARCRILLTGTPVQNALQDLWALMDFAQPGLLGNHATFVKHFSDPIDKGSVRNASPFAVGLKKHLCEQLWQLVKPHMLRRTKASVGLVGQAAPAKGDGQQSAAVSERDSGKVEKPLPPKLETVVFVTPTKEQLAAYQKVLEKSEVVQKASCKAKLGFEVFQAIGLLKRLCNHPALGLPFQKKGEWSDFLADASGTGAGISLVTPARGRPRKATEHGSDAPSSDVSAQAGDAGPESVPEARAGHAAEVMLKKLPRTKAALLEQSSKLRCLASMLPAFAARGHRTLVFCQGVKMLDLLEHCVLKPQQLKYLRVDGQADAQSRSARVNKFQAADSEVKFMLLTTSVGGYGLNLTAADRVVILDPAWNPATDLQAVERAHRIGQQKEVRIYRIVTSGLMEDKMFRLQVFKMGLAKTALDAEQPRHYFTTKEIKGLFEWCSEPDEMTKTRELLMQKHGPEHNQAVEQAAAEDGAHDGWLAAAGDQASLSNFSMLYTASQNKEGAPAGDCESQVQVTDMMKRLVDADEEILQSEQARKAAEERLAAAQAALGAVSEEVATAGVERSEAQEKAKQTKSILVQARRQEAQSQQRLSKALKARAGASERLMVLDQSRRQAERAAAAAVGAADESRDQALAAERAVALAADGVEAAALRLLSEDGEAAEGSPVGGAASKLKSAQKVLERFRKALECNLGARADLEAAEEARGAAKRGDKEHAKVNAARDKVLQRVESTRDAACKSAAALQEAGFALVDSFYAAASASSGELRATQQGARSAFRLLSTAWLAARKAQEAWCKSLNLRGTRLQQAEAADAACQEAEAQLAAAEKEQVEAEAEDAAACQAAATAAAEHAAREATLEEAELRASFVAKDRRQHLRAAVVAAKEEVKAAKASKRQAAEGRKGVIGQFSRAEKALLGKRECAGEEAVQLSAVSAMEALKAEEYDANQVEEAYQAKKKQKCEAAVEAE